MNSIDLWFQVLKFYKEENKEDNTKGNIYFIYVQNIAMWKYLPIKIYELKCRKKKKKLLMNGFFYQKLCEIEYSWNK